MEVGDCETALPHYLATADETIKQIAATAQDSPLAPVRLSQQWEDGRVNAPAQGEDTQVRKKDSNNLLLVCEHDHGGGHAGEEEGDDRDCKVWCVVCGCDSGVCKAMILTV